MLSTSLIEFSIDGQGCVPFLLFDLRPNSRTVVEVMKIMETSFKGFCACTATLSAPNPAGPPPTHTSAGDSWTLMGNSRSVSCWVTVPFS